MTRTMYDGINSDATAIHEAFPNAAMIAGYVDGHFAWSQADWNLFPHAVHVTITVLGGNTAADVVDCEAGDTTPTSAAAWVRARKAAGYTRPTIYCSRSVIPAVRKATGDLVLGKDYDIWCADYTGSAHQVIAAPPGAAVACAATQYENTSKWDVSVVYDDGWPHRTPPSVDTWPPNVTLREGDRGGAVRVLQTALRDSGLRGVRGITVDGIFGPQTLTSVRNFQAIKGLVVDGIAGPRTRAALIGGA
jgi:hypothetical protein